MKTFYIHSLGCAKTRVDSEYVVAMLTREGLTQVAKAEGADVIIINTCSFIEPSREESVDTILAMDGLRTEGQKLMVIGCLPQRYPNELPEALPEVDHFVGTANLDQVWELLNSEQKIAPFAPSSSWIPSESLPRMSSISPYSAYLKVSEGCDRACSFCAVPLIRGPQRSLSKAFVVREAQALAAQGVRELNIIAQDLTRWGLDRDERPDLADLLHELSTIDGITWIRLLYLYPGFVTPSLIEAMAQVQKVVPYVDIPVQHFADPVLRAMRRGYGEHEVLQTIEALRKAIPGIFLRTTLLTGHPGETDESFDLLLRRVEELSFDHLGVFPYSPEEGTHAFTLEAPPPEVALARADEVMSLQTEISRARLERLKGRRLPVLCESYDEESMVYVGRHWGQAPEVDGVTFLSEGSYSPGEIIPLIITDFAEYDCVASETLPSDEE